MRSVFKKTLAAGIAAALTAGMLAGCGASAPKLDGTRTALVVNGQEVTLGTMSFYAKFQQAMTASYYAMYGMTGEIFDTVADSEGKTVGESMKDPAKYYFNNVEGTLHLLIAMHETGVDHIVFSSTAAVYGEPEKTPIEEDFPTVPTNVYGRTKLMIENMMKDFTMAYGMDYVALRYFNAAGAIQDGSIGEDHNPETHLIPLILKTAQGVRDHISIFGTDYPTPDGTCLRDYIHVLDLADAHVLAMQYLVDGGESTVFNLGSETGFSVREIIEKAKKITGIDFKVEEEARRAGDPAVLIASSAKCKKVLGWKPQHSNTEEIIKTAWNWHKEHPYGFGI